METLDPTLEMTLATRLYDNRILPEHNLSLRWSEFAETMVNNHLLTDNKLEVPMIIPANLKSWSDTSTVWATYTEYEERNGLGAKGSVKLDESGKGFTGRVAENVVSWSMIPADYDGAEHLSISEAEERFKDIEYVLYTSYSHGTKKAGGLDRFRMFFPLSSPLSIEDMARRKKAIMGFLGGCRVDQTVLASARVFFLPSCSKENLRARYSAYHKGAFIGPDDFPCESTYPQTRPVAPIKELDEDEKVFLLGQIEKLGQVPYEVWWKIGSAMASSGYTENDFIRVSRSLRSHGQADISSQWRKSQNRGISLGYIINRLKEAGICMSYKPKKPSIKSYQLPLNQEITTLKFLRKK